MLWRSQEYSVNFFNVCTEMWTNRKCAAGGPSWLNSLHSRMQRQMHSLSPKLLLDSSALSSSDCESSFTSTACCEPSMHRGVYAHTHGIHACVWLASSSTLFRGSVTCVHHRYPAFLWMSHLLIPPLVTFVWWQLRRLSSCLTFFLFMSLRSGKWLCTAQLLWTLPWAINGCLVMSPQPDPK